MGRAGAAQLIVIIPTCTEKGKTTTVAPALSPADNRPGWPFAILCLRRGQWGIETVCHQRLDASCLDDKTRVRSLTGVAVLDLLSRVSLAFFANDIHRSQPQRDKPYPIWSARRRRHPRPMIEPMLKRCLPP